MAAELTDAQIEAIFMKCGGKWNGDQWVIEDADFHPMVRTLFANQQATQGAEPVGTLYVSKFRGYLENSSFEYTGSLPDGTYPLYTAPPPTAEVEKDAALRDLLRQAAGCIAMKVQLEQVFPDEPPMPASEWDYVADQLVYEIRAALQSDQAQAGKGDGSSLAKEAP